MSRPPAEAVVTRDGPAYTGSGPDGIHQIGSITKVFTGLLLAGEVVEGRLSLDQPIGDLVPLAGAPVAAASLAQLATHTSGLPRVPPGMWRKAFGEAARDPYADVDAAALLDAVRAAKLRRPGGRPAYSNLGYGLLGHALATHLGTTYADAVSERITQPLGMMDTGVVPADPERVVVGTTRRGKPHPKAWTFDAMAGAGALWSTASDMATFVAAQLDPSVDVLGRAMRLSHQVLVTGRIEVALAWMRLSGNDGALLWHNGGTAGYRSFVGVDHGRGRAVVVLGSSDRSVDRRGMELAGGLS